MIGDAQFISRTPLEKCGDFDSLNSTAVERSTASRFSHDPSLYLTNFRHMTSWLIDLGSADTGVQLDACNQALELIRPLLDACSSGPQQDVAAVRKLAREHGGMLTSTLKAISALLPMPTSSSAQPRPDSAAVSLELLADVACAALDGLDCLRQALKAKGLELETQRYGFIRRFMVHGLYPQALTQGWKLYKLMCAVESDAVSTLGRDLLELRMASLTSMLAALVEVMPWPASDARRASLPLDPALQLQSILQGVEGFLLAAATE